MADAPDGVVGEVQYRWIGQPSRTRRRCGPDPQASSLAPETPRLRVRWDDGHSIVFGPRARSQGTRALVAEAWTYPAYFVEAVRLDQFQGGQRASGRVRPSSGRAAGRWSAPPAVDPSWLVAHDRSLVIA